MSPAYGQDNHEVETPGHTISVEGGGRFFLIGAVAEFRLHAHHAVSMGTGIYSPWNGALMYHFLHGKNTSHLELGAGTVIRYKPEGRESYLIPNLWIGYRYQKEAGLLLRAGFSPSIDLSSPEEGDTFIERFGALLPFGIGLGYSF